jgi:hypothetical protein
MLNKTLIESLKHLLTLNLVEVLLLLTLIVAFSSITLRLTKTKRDSLIFIVWGAVVLVGFLAVQWLNANPDLMKIAQVNGFIPVLLIFIVIGIVFGAMAFGLWRIFFGGSSSRRQVYVFKSSIYSPRRAKRNGRKDGAVGANSQHYEDAIVHFAEQNANAVAQQWNENDKKLKARYCAAVAAREASQADLIKTKEVLKKATLACEAEEKSYKSTYSTHHLGTRAYWFLIVLIGLAEAPFNLAAFRAIMGEIEVVNIFFSLVVSGIFAFAVHFLGSFFAENPFEKGFKKAVAKNLTAVAAGLFLILMIVGLAIFREGYIASFQQQLASYGISSNVSPTTASIVLGVIVAFFAFLAINVSSRRYRPEIAGRIRALADARRRLRIAQIENRRTEQRHQLALKRFYEAEADRKSEFSFMRHVVGTMDKRMQELIKLYRMHYERSAKGKRPGEAVSFGQLPSIELPEALRVLDERCEV